MNIHLQKTTLSLILLMGISVSALANNLVTSSSALANPSSLAANPQSKAIEFARQAGTIAGIAQACGQNVSDFSVRITEAINKLTNNPTDIAGALLIYQRIAQEAEMTEKKNQVIPCSKVLQDYHNLPIMQPNYKTTVIAQLDSSGS
jgi:hypothetical protein